MDMLYYIWFCIEAVAFLFSPYDPHGNLSKVTDPNGNVSRFKYAPNHYLTEIIDPRGVCAVRTEYDDDCYKLICETRTGFHPYAITFTYDNVGKRTTQTHDGVLTSYT